MFSDYLKRQLSHRGKVYENLDVSKATYYRHLDDPNQITLGELKQMMLIGELKEERVMDFICRRTS